MDRFQHIIKMAQKLLSCPICKRKYNIEEIKLKGWFENIYFLQANCFNNHKPVSIFVVISNKPINQDIVKAFESYNKNYTSNINKHTFSQLLTKEINNFDGDFEKLWKK